MNTAYQTLIVKFSEPITVLNDIFDNAEAWGTDTTPLKGGLMVMRTADLPPLTPIRQS